MTLDKPHLGYKGPSKVAYDIGYFADIGAVPLSEERPVRDLRAYSVAAPIDLEDRYANTWPAFLLDLVPQGRQAKRITEFLKSFLGKTPTEVDLLLRSAGSPVGNLRIKEAHTMETDQVKNLKRVGVTMDDVLRRDPTFLEVADHFSMLASGSNGLQGDWPKVALTQSTDGLWYPNSMVEDGEARVHVIAKLLRSGEATDQRILEAEAGYSKVAKDFGLNVEGVGTYGDGVLIIPRFDRLVTGQGLVRFGQESLISAIGVAEFAPRGRHETYLAMIQRVSADPLQDTIEYLLRDILNLAMGNPDNHGRNTALRKFPDGSVRLAPLFDFAPMRIDASSIPRATIWECMRLSNQDTNPDWRVVCEAVARPDVPAETLMEALAAKEDLLRALPELARRHDVPETVVEHVIVKHEKMADGVAKLRNVPTYG
ncbi:HipA domain-containing protein [Bradyrhizobium liaoningense]|uniref:type II toxin-antitoxin system HipA family toxin n=1 Tax=Bradyrhizobium liaoningense TaxID=43992 RepID=UPI001BA66A6A|nr:HipA domain-containing protein [Bradyrhizobium liaoningense]MBR0822408.1 type II toxin-antitoxin system HipA family toxin [Bradyrhizobium liaoningense]